MAIHITASGAQPIGLCDAILVQVNTAFTGGATLTITSGGSTQYGTSSGTVAVLTDAPVNGYRYGGLRGQGIISINPSATCDVTVTVLSRVR